ncbi:ImmA/IrrE family metallo-endopeptidase [Metasolibacillus sp. FSL H7-0170]|uniref:ImmA/IrrE family metallo-endopeptidase n=1 Tax=Metasolibacillus sp. FSL H7-0170 TaxID=2921431 RepID=UPI00315862EA
MRTLSYTEEFIKALYLKIGMMTPLQLNFKTIAKSLGIHLFCWPHPSQALFFVNTGYIMINENLTPQQQWQDFCHELCHILLHTGHQGRMPPLFRSYQEYKASNFMYHACVPTFMLDALEPAVLTAHNIQHLFNVEYEFAMQRLERYLNNLNPMPNLNIS